MEFDSGPANVAYVNRSSSQLRARRALRGRAAGGGRSGRGRALERMRTALHAYEQRAEARAAMLELWRSRGAEAA